MIPFLRRLLGRERPAPIPAEARNRRDGLRAASRATNLAARLREARRQELTLRLQVRSRR